MLFPNFYMDNNSCKVRILEDRTSSTSKLLLESLLLLHEQLGRLSQGPKILRSLSTGQIK